MNKPTKKNHKPRRVYNPDILERINAEFGFGINYIQKCLRGDRKGIMPDKVVKMYNRLDVISKKAIQKTENPI